MKNKLKIVLDTNVFIDSMFRDVDSANEIMELIESDNLTLCFSQETIGELMYVMKKQAIISSYNEDAKIALMSVISEMFVNSVSCNTKYTRSPKIQDKDDEMFVKCAIKGKAHYLISNDKKSGMHQLRNMKFNILTSKEFLDEYELLVQAENNSANVR